MKGGDVNTTGATGGETEATLAESEDVLTLVIEIGCIPKCCVKAAYGF